MRLLLLFSFLLLGCAGKTIYLEKPNLAPLQRKTEEIRTIIKTIETPNQTAIAQVEQKLLEQEIIIKESDEAVAKLSLENSKKETQILNLSLNEAKLTKRNIKLLLATITIAGLLIISIALRFVNFKLI